MRGFAVMCEKYLCDAKLVLAKKFPHVLLMNSAIQNECGIQFVRAMKNSGCAMPTIFIVDRCDIDKLIIALDAGDDAMQKPIIIGELCARIRLILRRSYFSNLQNRKNIDLSDRDQEVICCNFMLFPKFPFAPKLKKCDHLRQ
jgi:DNA-binding response OmpR family regulator